MVTVGTARTHRPSTQSAYTLIELLAVTFIVGIATIVYVVVRPRFGFWPATLATALDVVASAVLIVAFYSWDARRTKRLLAELRDKYRGIYKVKQLPGEVSRTIKPEGAEIQVGDFGWEARAKRADGLIHLQGLTGKWEVVWHAAFRPDEIERVAEKPTSQYDYWNPYWAKVPPPPQCPYPVQERTTQNMGLPHYSGTYFVRVAGGTKIART